MTNFPVRGLQYTPLRVDNKEIRLFRLKSGSFQPPRRSPRFSPDMAVFGELEHIHEGDATLYTALSYTWGDGVDRRPIGVGLAVLYISANLEGALRQLQDEQNDLLLWADQICINQQDDKEKTGQVQQMKTIFSGADHVITWLGPAADRSDLLISLLSLMGSGVNEEKGCEVGELDEKSFRNTINSTFADVLLAIANSTSVEAVSRAFDKFCQRSYWRRLWVLQEFAVARKLDIMCGSSRLSHYQLQYALDAIARTLYYLEDLEEAGKDNEEVRAGYAITKAFASFASSFMEGIVTRRHRYQSADASENSLFQVLISSLVLESDYNHPECSDPRDRIFAILGLADDAVAFDEFPDYTMSCKDTYTKAARKFLDQGHIDILSYCQFPRDGSIPTWAPDWRLPTFNPNTYTPPPTNPTFSAAGNSFSRQKIFYKDSDSITISGLPVDIVKEYGGVWNPNWLERLHPESTLKYLAEVKAFTVQSPQISGGSEDMETSRIAIADFACAGDPEKAAEALTFYLRLLKDFTMAASWGQVDETTHVEPWYNRALRLLHSRRPFISTSGLVGLAPSHVEVGDMICIFLGGHVPYLLRKCGEGYTLVGEAYVHGIMHGECVTGHLKIERFTLR